MEKCQKLKKKKKRYPIEPVILSRTSERGRCSSADTGTRISLFRMTGANVSAKGAQRREIYVQSRRHRHASRNQCVNATLSARQRRRPTKLIR